MQTPLYDAMLARAVDAGITALDGKEQPPGMPYRLKLGFPYSYKVPTKVKEVIRDLFVEQKGLEENNFEKALQELDEQRPEASFWRKAELTMRYHYTSEGVDRVRNYLIDQLREALPDGWNVNAGGIGNTRTIRLWDNDLSDNDDPHYAIRVTKEFHPSIPAFSSLILGISTVLTKGEAEKLVKTVMDNNEYTYGHFEFLEAAQEEAKFLETQVHAFKWQVIEVDRKGNFVAEVTPAAETC